MHDGVVPRRRDGHGSAPDEEAPHAEPDPFSAEHTDLGADGPSPVSAAGDPHAPVMGSLTEGMSELSEPLSNAAWMILRVCVGIAALGLVGGGMLFVLSEQDVASRRVDRSTCGGCACWDTLSKAPYPAGGYRYVYHNMEIQTLLLIGMIVIACNALERTLARLGTIVRQQRLSVLAAAVLPLSVVGVTTSLGAMWHYINDNQANTNAMIPTQMYFLVTELLSAFCVTQCLATTTPSSDAGLAKAIKDVGVSAKARELCAWVVLCNSVCHVYLSGSDQVVHDLLFSSTATVQKVVRGNIFAVTDIGMLLWAAHEVGLLKVCCSPQSRRSFRWGTFAGCMGVAAAVCFWYKTFLPQV